MQEDHAVGLISEYLKENFSGSSVEHEMGSEGEVRISVMTSDGTFHLKVERAFFRERGATRLKTDLEEYNVAGVLKQLKGFTVLLSNSGCVFDPF